MKLINSALGLQIMKEYGSPIKNQPWNQALLILAKVPKHDSPSIQATISNSETTH